MKNPKHERKREEHRKAIKRAGGIGAYNQSKLWGSKKLKEKDKNEKNKEK